MAAKEKRLVFKSMGDFHATDTGPSAELYGYLGGSGNFNFTVEFEGFPIVPLRRFRNGLYQIGTDGQGQTIDGLLYIFEGWVLAGKRVTVNIYDAATKAAPLALGQGMSPQPGMKGNLGGYFSPKEMGIGTVALLGVGGYLLYKAMKKR